MMTRFLHLTFNLFAAIVVGCSAFSSPLLAITLSADSVTLIDTTTNLAVSPEYDPIPNGAILDLSRLPLHLAIRPNLTGIPKSVFFNLDGSTHLDGTGPTWSLCGDNDLAVTYTPCNNLNVRIHNLVVTPYSGPNKSGIKGTSLNFTFTVVKTSQTVLLNAASATLINTVTNKPVAGYDSILNGATITLPSLPAKLSIRGNIIGAARSVLFDLDGKTHLDGGGQIWSLCGDNDSAVTYTTCPNLTAGPHNLVIAPFSGTNESGTKGTPLTLNFTIATSVPPPPDGPVVDSVSLIDTDTNTPVAAFDPIPEGATIDLSMLPSSNLSIRANVTGTATSVVFDLDATPFTDDVGPIWSLCGDDSGVYSACQNLTVGTHQLTVTPNDGTTNGTALTRNFAIVNNVQPPPNATRQLYALNETGTLGSISVYDIDAGHTLIKTIKTVPSFNIPLGIAGNAKTGMLYVSYQATNGSYMIYALNIMTSTVVWNKVITPGVDRLAVSPDGTKLYVPTNEALSDNYINILDALTGDLIQTLTVATHTHDTQFPLSGPLYQECRATDGTCNKLYMIDPVTNAITTIGNFAGVIGPFAVDSTGTYSVQNTTGIWGFQVANLKTNTITTATIPINRPSSVGLPHGIGWLPNQTEVWEAGTSSENNVYVFDMANPAAPVYKQVVTLSTGGVHWINFSIAGDYAYVSGNKSASAKTEIFNTASHSSVGLLSGGGSEELIEVDFTNGVITAVGDQFGIGRK